MRIRSNLKAIADQQGLSALQLSKDIEYRYESVRTMYNDTAKHYPGELLLRLCLKLNVKPGELLILDDKKEPTE
ncbi:helix-turn-helix domain-containing protein [Paenibacillus sp. LHD-117]|uniref:helix-turn-helix domain-containing protein n=1 Tax=Paenibacillus sp. LHD-117 TaxID=3071412 RepID=UPI0027E1B201|nr:helix-turn-helix domain-containing protein [Paenibacillus sp. LHD-117]MDQ6418672.1 helix-turn-helix domain-containing protein [Paenibacillus sp. LHD-117]